MEPAIPPQPPEPPADEPVPAAEPAPPPPAAASIPGQRSGSPRATRPAEPAAGGDPGRSDRRDAPARDGTGREPAGAPATGAEAEAQAVGEAGADGGTEGSAPSPDAAAGRAVPARTAARKTAKAAPTKAAAKKGPAKKTAAKKAAKKTVPGTATALPDAPPESADRTPEQAGQRQQQDREQPRAATPVPAGIPEPALWERLRGDPAHAPEILALAAVEWLGPEAERYAGWARATYPGATGDRLARAAGRRFAAQARSGALAGVIAPEIGQVIVLGWLQARLVLHVAAAYGRDARAPERAAELLVLLRVHDDLASARGALAPAGDTGVPPRRPAHRLARLGTRGVARRLAARLIPGAGVLVDLLVNDASMEHLTRRAISFYRTPSATVSGAPADSAS